MQASARPALLSLVEEHLTGLVREAMAVQRHCKRARAHEGEDGKPSIRRRLHAADINMALSMRGSEKLYGTPVIVPENDDSTKRVELEDFLRQEAERMPQAPSEVGLQMHWLAVDGVQPEIPQNPTSDAWVQDLSKADTAPAASDAAVSEGDSSGLLVNQLQAAMLSEELQLYFARVTLAMERGSATPINAQQQDAVILSVSRDPGLQELVPFLVRYCQQELYKHIGNAEHCRTLVRLALALLQNPHVHLELHLHELLPALMTCVVAKRLASNHWALRREAAVALIQACNLYGSEYSTLKAKVLRSLCDAIGSDKSLASRYGGFVAITLFGPKAIDAFLLPNILASWEEWEENVEDDPLGVHMCQQAALNALGVFLRRVNDSDKAGRLEWRDLEDTFGDKLVPLQGDQTEYAMCFI